MQPAGRHVLVATDLFRQGRIGRTEDQPRLVSFQPQPSIARGILADLDRHVPGNVVLRELLERLDDLGRRDPRREHFQIESGVIR